MKDRDSIVGKISFDDHGQNTVAVITKYVVQDGKFVEWDDSEYASGKRKLPGAEVTIGGAGPRRGAAPPCVFVKYKQESSTWTPVFSRNTS